MGNNNSSSSHNVVLVVGKGVIGRSIIEYLDTKPDEWRDVIVLATSDPDFETRARTIKVDLLDTKDVEAKLSGGAIAKVTHVFYCGLAPGGTDDTETNVAMLKNVVSAVDKHAPKLQRVLLNTGLKRYGVHLGKFKTPARETDPRGKDNTIFYYEQHDALRAAAEGKRWDWVEVVPDVVCGYAVGQMNLAVTIAAYCAIQKELGLPLTFPGKKGCFDKLAQVCFAPHLARACEFAATSATAGKEVYNVVNGDYFRWETVFPQFAKHFGLEFAGVKTRSLAKEMADKGEVWDRIVAKHGLKPIKLDKLASWGFADWVFGAEFDVMADTTKIRQAGFADVVDSEDMFARMFDDFARMGVLPPLAAVAAV